MFIAIFVGVIFILTAYWYNRYLNYYKNNGTILQAKCIGYETIHKIYRNRSNVSRNHTSKIILKYIYQGEEILASVKQSNQSYQYNINENVSIYALNDGPEYISIEDNSSKFILIIFFIAGLIAMSFGFYKLWNIEKMDEIIFFELSFVLYATFMLNRYYTKIKKKFDRRVFKSAKIENDDTLNDPNRKLHLTTQEIRSIQTEQYNTGLYITYTMLAIISGFFYLIWQKQSKTLRERIINHLQNLDYQYFLDQILSKNEVIIILTCIYFFFILIMLSLILQYKKKGR